MNVLRNPGFKGVFGPAVPLLAGIGAVVGGGAGAGALMVGAGALASKVMNPTVPKAPKVDPATQSVSVTDAARRRANLNRQSNSQYGRFFQTGGQPTGGGQQTTG